MTSCDLALTSNITCTCLILLEYVQYVFRSDVAKFEADLTCLATVRDQSVNKLDVEVNEIRFRSTVLAGLSNAV